MYHELLFHLDLCILAYHQYTQALAWPFDPYYEQMAALGTSRRDTFMTYVRDNVGGVNNPDGTYHGPGSAYGWSANEYLDPVLQRYDRLYPWYPAFCSPEVGNWLYYKVPGAIVDSIANVSMCSYRGGQGDPNNNGVIPIDVQEVSAHPRGLGTDHLYCFEGGTGRIDQTAVSWSLMGCVLDRETLAGYDVHIAFRGSRSGGSGRAVVHGMREKGNPDWVTDMDARPKVQVAAFGKRGSVCRGFSRAVTTCMPTIMEALKHIANRRGAAPQNIYVTGHSLGGALAGSFAAAMILGDTWGPNGQGGGTPATIQNWPWARLQLISFSAPIVGDYRLQEEFNARIFGRRVWLGEDPVTTENLGYHVGAPVLLSTTSSNVLYYSKKAANAVYLGALVGTIGAASTTWHHEPMYVRENLILSADAWGAALPDELGKTAAHAHFPWKVYTSFKELLSANREVLTRKILGTTLANFGKDVAKYMNIFAEVMALNAAYKTVISTSTAKARTKAVTTAVSLLGKNDQSSAFQVVKDVAKSAEALMESYDGFGKHVAFAMILSDLLSYRDEKKAYPLTQLLNQDALQPYLI